MIRSQSRQFGERARTASAPRPGPYARTPNLTPDVSVRAGSPAAIARRNTTVQAAAGFAYEAPNGLPDFTLTSEQREIDFFVETMGWVGFFVQIKAMLGSMCPWFIEKREGQEWVKAKDPRIQAMANYIRPPVRTQLGMRYRSLSLQASIGEHAFWPVRTQERGLCFDIGHPDQMRRGMSTETFGVATRRDARPSQGFGYQEFPIDRLKRHWVPHPKWPDEARVELVRAVTEMRIYRSTVLNLHRSADSRLLMNGLLWVSTNDGSDGKGDWVQPRDEFDPGDDTPATPQGGGLDDLIAEFAKFGARAFRDHRGEDVASRLPFVFPHHSEPKMIEIGRGIDGETLTALSEVVRAGARGLSIPTEFLVMGEGTANHWNDAELRRSLHERAVYPELVVNDEFWTDYALRPLLALSRPGGLALADDDPAEYRLNSDTTVLDVKSDSPALALQAWNAGLASASWAASKIGIAEGEMLELPDDIGSYEHWVNAKASASRSAFETLIDADQRGLDTAAFDGTDQRVQLPDPQSPPGGDGSSDGGFAPEPSTEDAVSAGALALIRRRR